MYNIGFILGLGAIVGVLADGTVPFMVADALKAAGGRAPFWHRLIVRHALILSQAAAVKLR